MVRFKMVGYSKRIPKFALPHVEEVEFLDFLRVFFGQKCVFSHEIPEKLHTDTQNPDFFLSLAFQEKNVK